MEMFLNCNMLDYNTVSIFSQIVRFLFEYISAYIFSSFIIPTHLTYQLNIAV